MPLAKATAAIPLVAKGKLLRILGLGFGLAITIGGTIGVSIFRLPGPITALLGFPLLILLVWILGGIYTLLSANYTAELATMLPKAGGPYIYARRAFGEYIGFVIGWTACLGEIAALSFLSIAVGEYTVTLLPDFSLSPIAVALFFLVSLTIVNWIGIRMGSGVQKLTSLLKTLALLIFVALCFSHGSPGESLPHPRSITHTGIGLFAAFSLAFQMVLGAYGGWNTVVYFSEEDKNPARNIPRSLHLGVLLVIGIYLLVNLALLYVLPTSTLAASPLAAADAMNLIWGPVSSRVLTLIAIVSILGTMNAVFLFLPRALLALGRDGLFTSKATMVNQGGTPFFALAVCTIAAIVLVTLGTFETLMAIYSFYAVATNILLIAALFILRKREPNLPRPFKTWAYPYAPAVLFLVSIFLFSAYVISDTRNSLYAIAILAISYPVYKLIKPHASTIEH